MLLLQVNIKGIFRGQKTGQYSPETWIRVTEGSTGRPAVLNPPCHEGKRERNDVKERKQERDRGREKGGRSKSCSVPDTHAHNTDGECRNVTRPRARGEYTDELWDFKVYLFIYLSIHPSIPKDVTI